MTRKESGAKNKPPSAKKAGSGPTSSHYNRGNAGEKRSGPKGVKSGKAKDVGSNSSEFGDLSH